MCVYIDTEVVLENLLKERTEISLNNISLYCGRLVDLFREKEIPLCLNYNSRELENTLRQYSSEYKLFGEVIHKVKSPRTDFTSSYRSEIRDTMQEAKEVLLST